MFRDIGAFVIAVVRHWQGYVTGGFVMAGLAAYEKLSGRAVDRKIYAALFFGGFFLLSCFFAWRDQHRLARLLDDRSDQHEKADEYAPLLQVARRIMVKWVDVSLRPPATMTLAEAIAAQRAAAFAWLDTVKKKLDEDFGVAVAVRFNLGKPADVSLGVSEPTVNIAHRVLELNREPQVKPYIDLPRMAEQAQRMVKESLDAFVARDAELGRRVCAADDAVDGLRDQIFRELLTFMMEDARTIPRAIRLILISRFFERVADHATNVAEMVIYMVEGTIVRHTLA